MKPSILKRNMVVLTLSFVFVTSGAMAELSTEPNGSDSFTTILTHIYDGPDPIGAPAWQQVRSIPPERLLNTSGAGRGDGGPDIAWQADGKPVVTWAYWAGTDFDIAVSEWDGSAWTPAEFLTSSTQDELDPRVFVESDGTVHVAWWVDDTIDQVFVSTRAAGSTLWSDPAQVSPSATGGRRPSVAVFNGVLRVAYERASQQPGSQEIVVARQEAGGGFVEEIVAQTTRTARLDAVLHTENGRLWVDWKQDTGLFGYAERGGTGWNSPSNQPWSSDTWIGVEDVRRTIRRNLLNQ